FLRHDCREGAHMTIRAGGFAAIVLGLGRLAGACSGTPLDTVEADHGQAQRLTIYTARDKDEVAQVIDQFVQRYPKYKGKVNAVTLSAQDALTRLRAERSNPQAGFLWGGTQQGLQQAADEQLLAASTPDIASRIDPSRKDPRGRW